jgi:D-alanine-D-alanine ligase
MQPTVALVYNEPLADRYQAMGEAKAILGVMDEVQAVQQALIELDYPCIPVPLRPPFDSACQELKGLKADVVFNLFEGFAGRPETEAMIAKILEEAGIPHTGCPSSTLSLALDKAKTKDIILGAGILTPRYQLLTPETLDAFDLAFPCIVKPCSEDASHGISESSVVYNRDLLKSQLNKICGLFGGRALIEEFLEGREFNTTVLGNKNPRALAISEIVYSLPEGIPKILTFSAKWEDGSVYFQGTMPVCPAEIGEKKQRRISAIALKAYKLLGCRGYARVDLREDSLGDPKVLEINPNPDITPGSGAARQAVAAGMTYSGFIEEVIRLARVKG